MPKKLTDCVTKTTSSLRGQRPDWSDKRIERVAYASCVKSTGQKMIRNSDNSFDFFNVQFSESGKMDTFQFAFSTPIKVIEKSTLVNLAEQRKFKLPDDPDAVVVSGTAIYETESKNLHIYEEEELIKAAHTLVGIPCQKDHSWSMKDTFGKVVDGWYEASSLDKKGELPYIAFLDGDDPDSHKVRKGYVVNVSVAGSAEQILCTICGEELTWDHEHWLGETYDDVVCKARMIGLRFQHLGFTPFPAIIDADAEYIPESMDEAIDNALAYAEHIRISKSHKVQQKEFGDSLMPNDEHIKEIERLKLQMEQKDIKLAEMKEQADANRVLEQKLARIEKEEHGRLVESVIDARIELKFLAVKDKRSERDNLEEMSKDVLEAKLGVLQETIANLPDPISESPTPISQSKSKQFGDRHAIQVSDEKKAVLEKEVKKDKIALMFFGQRPSISAVETCQSYDKETGRWKNLILEVFKK